MNDIENIVYEAMEEITGLGIDELKQIKSLSLFENGILDSLSFANFISMVEKKINVSYDISKLEIKDICCIESIINVLKNNE